MAEADEGLTLGTRQQVARSYKTGAQGALHHAAFCLHQDLNVPKISKPRQRNGINLEEKFSRFSEQWAPKVIAEMNDYQFKVVRLQGDFIWHSHAETDEAFLVVEGELRIDFRDGHVLLRQGELYVVARGVEHKPYAEHEVKLMLIEPRGIANTGETGGERTALNDRWI